MRKSEYLEKLKDPRWQRKRLEILQRDKFMCQACGEDSHTLHVHHRYYIPGAEPWEAPSESLVTLCADCHETESEEMAAALADINEYLRVKCLAGDVWELAYALRGKCIRESARPTEYIHGLSVALESPGIMNELIEIWERQWAEALEEFLR